MAGRETKRDCAYGEGGRRSLRRRSSVSLLSMERTFGADISRKGRRSFDELPGGSVNIWGKHLLSRLFAMLPGFPR